MGNPLSSITGTVERRILVNYRIDPLVAAAVLPPQFRPTVVNGSAIGGICLIRMSGIHPLLFPFGGVTSENAAHRFAVHAATGDARGVFVPRRDTSSRLSILAGKVFFPAAMRHAKFETSDDGTDLTVALESSDHSTKVDVHVRRTGVFPASSTFASIEEASAFFRNDPGSFSPTGKGQRFSEVQLEFNNWNLAPLELVKLESKFFDDRERFPLGSIAFDSAFLMENSKVRWTNKGTVAADAATGVWV